MTSSARLRPESVVLNPGPDKRDAILLEGEVRKVTFLGREAQYAIATPAGDMLALVADADRGVLAQTGARMKIALPFDRLAAFGADGGRVALAARP